MQIFNTNIQTIGEQLTPTMLRKPLFLAILAALLAPFVWLANSVRSNRQANIDFLKITGQVNSLEKALNDFFEVQNIYITDGIYRDPLWLALEAEQRPLRLGLASETPPLWLCLQSETGVDGPAFTVHCPLALQPRENEIAAFVNKFKLAGKTFSITFFK